MRKKCLLEIKNVVRMTYEYSIPLNRKIIKILIKLSEKDKKTKNKKKNKKEENLEITVLYLI